MFQKVAKFVYLWLPPLLMCGVIFYLSSLSNLKLGEGTPEFIRRKLVHLLEYGFLAILFYRALEGKVEVRLKDFMQSRQFWVALIFTSLFALSDEIHQRFVPTRTCKIYDLAFDAIGVFLGLCLLNLSQRFVKQKILKWKE